LNNNHEIHEQFVSQENHASKTAPNAGRWRWKLGILVGIALIAASAYAQFGHLLDLDYLAERETELRQLRHQSPVLVYGVAFLIYVCVAALLPGATVMSLLYGWYFRFWGGLALISFASTTGATVSFLLSRYLFRDVVERCFRERTRAFSDAFEREGALYLFTLRLVPVVPFFVINIVMGLTRMRAWTFWWVSQLGMLAGTIVYVYAASRVPDLATLADKGAEAVFTRNQLIQLAIAFGLLGVFPLLVRRLVSIIRNTASSARSR
jgi:uncharacterized membrane protein YdjX (TVP38/TMEM64 family)